MDAATAEREGLKERLGLGMAELQLLGL